MRFWIREIAGWLLVLAGLYFCLISVSMMTANPSLVFSAIPIATIGIFVFRGGIHLLKVAMAARVAMAFHQKREPAKRALPPAIPTPHVAPEEW